MRFKLILYTEKQYFGDKIPLSYQYECSAVIYRIFSRSNAAYSEWLHTNGFKLENGKQFKLFAYSRLIIERFRRQGDLLQILSNTVEWHISFLPERSTQEFIQGIFREQSFEIGNKQAQVRFTVKSIEMMPAPAFTETMVFETLSPVCLPYKRNDGSVEYLNPIDERALGLLKENLLQKYQAFTGNPFAKSDFPFELKVLSQPKSVLITIKSGTLQQTKVRGYLCSFSLTAPIELMHIMYECGAGSKNSQGFGMVRGL